MSERPYTGTPPEQTNWTKFPNKIIDHLHLITSGAELKIIVYIVRHTWGYNEFDEGKNISIDEFMHGRKRRNGTRIDDGCGLQKQAVISGIKAAIVHGFIDVDVDDRDAARVKKYYRLRGEGTPQCQDQTPQQTSMKVIQQGYESHTPGVWKSYTDQRKTLKKETKETHHDGGNPHHGESVVFDDTVETNKTKDPTPKNKRRAFTDRDFDRAEKLKEMTTANSVSNRKARLCEWAHEFRKLREVDKVPEEIIDEILLWYCRSYGKVDFMPEAFSGKTFRNKFDAIQRARTRHDAKQAGKQGMGVSIKPKTKEQKELIREIYLECLAKGFQWQALPHPPLSMIRSMLSDRGLPRNLLNVQDFEGQLPPDEYLHPDNGYKESMSCT